MWYGQSCGSIYSKFENIDTFTKRMVPCPLSRINGYYYYCILNSKSRVMLAPDIVKSIESFAFASNTNGGISMFEIFIYYNLKSN